MKTKNGQSSQNKQDMCFTHQAKSTEEIHMKTLDRIGLLKTLPMEEEITGEVSLGRGTKCLRIKWKLLVKGEQDLLVGQGTGTKGRIIETKMAKKGLKQGVKKKGEESLWVELRENMTAQKKKETEVTPPSKSPIRRVKVKGLHRKKTTPKNIQEVTPPTPERKCSRQTIAKTNQEMMTGIWTDSDMSPPETPKIITNPIQARKITEMKITMTSQEDMTKYGKAEEIVGTVQKEERRKIATPIRRNMRKEVQKGKKTQATIVRINENDDKEEDSNEDVSDFEESETEINLDNERKISSLYTENTSRQDVKPSTSHTKNASGQQIKPSTSNSSTDSTDSSDEYEEPYNLITRAELMKDGSYYGIEHFF